MHQLTTIKAYEELSGDHALTPAEQNLIAACRLGQPCTLSNTRPESPTPDTQIRATLLRLLIVGGSADCGLPDSGVSLHGAYITDTLNLDFATARGATSLNACTFFATPHLMQAHLRYLSLEESQMPGLMAQGMVVDGPVLLRKIVASAKVDVSSAQITGPLDCDGASFDGQAKVPNIVNLAFTARQTKVKQGFIWRNIKTIQGTIGVNSAHVGALVDDLDSWPDQVDQVILEGFVYDHLTFAPTDAKVRIDWLRKGANRFGTFYPQPYTQLAKVLSNMGHAREARLVLMEREHLLAADLLHRHRKECKKACKGDPVEKGDSGWIWLLMQGARLWSGMIHQFAGYGYAPQRALYWSLALTLISTVLFFIAYRQGWMVPSSAIVLTSPDWLAAYQADPVRPALHWSGAAATHYETFYALPYAFDVYLPIVDLGYSSTWGQTTTTWPGTLLRGWTLLLQAAGYIITGLGLAAITGLIQRDRS